MKTTIEVSGFEIVIEEVDGVVSVSASKEGDVVEEFTLDLDGEEGSESSEDEGDIKGFEEFGQGEEEDFDSEEGSDEDSDEDSDENADEELEEEEMEIEAQEEEEDEDEAQLESFQSFINSSKRKSSTKKSSTKKRK